MPLNLKRTPDNDDEPDAPPAIGHNSHSSDINWDELLDLDAIRMWLGEEYEVLLTKKKQLMDAKAAFDEKFPDGLKTDADVGIANDIGGQLKAQAKKIEDTRVIVKKPFFDADKAVQAWFRNLGEPLEAAVKAIEGKIGAYNKAKADRLRREAEEDARLKREEAARAMAAAEATQNPDIIDEAIIAEKAAGHAEKLASGPAANFTRARGDFAMSSSSVRYAFEVEDKSLVPLEYLVIDEAKVKRAINGKERVTAIPGLKIFDEMKTTIRT